MKKYSLTIEAGKHNHRYLKDILVYHELFLFLAWRDILVRYKQTIIGVAWSVIRPLLTMIVFTIVFGRLAKLPSDGIPYPILVYTAMLPWQLFANTVSEGGIALINNSHLVSKVYFPRIIIPSTSLVVSFVDFAISMILLGGIMIWYKFIPSWKIITLPLFLAIACVTALGIVYWVSALNVKYRDFQFVVPFMVQFGLYISPVGFSSSIVPDKWRLLYSINPLCGVIDGFRWAIIGSDVTLYIPGFILSIVLSAVLFISGFIFFRSTERGFADFI